MANKSDSKRPAKRPRASGVSKPHETALAGFKPTALLGSVTTLGLPSDDVAQSYMHFILMRVTVILDRRRWRVGKLKEFYPRGQSLLGLNVERGQEVCVRFRIPASRDQFLPFHEVLCTTLHELAHCVHSRHDKVFWALYYDLVKECEALEVRMVEQGLPLYPPSSSASSSPTASSGLTGRHFITASDPGHRLGGGGAEGGYGESKSAPLPATPEERRRLLAAAAAQRRAAAQPVSVTPASTSSGVLDAEPPSAPDDVPATPPRERDEGWQCPRCTFWNTCPAAAGCAMCGDDDDGGGGDNEAEEDGASAPENADGDASPPTTPPLPDRGESVQHDDDPFVTFPRRNVDHTHLLAPSAEAQPQWACERCTLLNPTSHTVCEVCGAARPPSFAPVLSSGDDDSSVVIVSDTDSD